MDTVRQCARHPERPAVTICARCDRWFCLEDLVEAPVGRHCLECVRQAAPTRTVTPGPRTPGVTRAVLMSIIAVAALEVLGVIDLRAFALVPVRVGNGEWWRLVTSAFLHAGIVHLGFNGILLWQLGLLLEPRIGPRSHAGLLLAGMAGGSLGVVLLARLSTTTPLRTLPILGPLLATDPRSLTVGASGAVFGLMGAYLGLLRREGVDPRRTQAGSAIGGLLIINLVLTFLVPSISVGGHVGGLLAGLGAAFLIPRQARRDVFAGSGAPLLVLAVGLLGLALLIARGLAG